MSAPTQAIERLQKKLEKEPNSLVFLQLVEEYRKEGLLNEALLLCREGLQKHPNYWSAHVALGRIYYEMGDLAAAGGELEKVIRSVPDNLLANRLLGDIYTRMNKPADALKRYLIVQMITPADREVQAQIERLEARAPRVEPREEAAPTVMIPALKDRMTFPELEPQPMGELEQQQGKDAETPPQSQIEDYALSEERPAETVTEELVPGLPEVPSIRSEADSTLRVEPAEYAPGETFATEEVLFDRTETVEPELPEPVAAEIMNEPVEAASDTMIDIKATPPEEKPVEITPPLLEPIFTESAAFEEAVASVPLTDTAGPELNDAPAALETSDSDELARIASIFLEEQPEAGAMSQQDSLPLPDQPDRNADREEIELQRVESMEDFSTVDAELGELEQVLEETPVATPRRDSTQPIVGKEEDDTSPDAEELTPETLAEIYVEQGQIDRAVKVYQKVLLHDPGNEEIQSKLQRLNPVDALIASASHAELQPVQAASAAPAPKHEQPAQRNQDQLSEERRRKINTLENWLASIRREG
jgi:tetratricopeptide (TPR) repeat protein